MTPTLQDLTPEGRNAWFEWTLVALAKDHSMIDAANDFLAWAATQDGLLKGGDAVCPTYCTDRELASGVLEEFLAFIRSAPVDSPGDPNAEQKAAFARGERIEFRHARPGYLYSWKPCPEPSWYSHYEYRIAPTEPKP